MTDDLPRFRFIEPRIWWQGDCADHGLVFIGHGEDGKDYALTFVAKEMSRHGLIDHATARYGNVKATIQALVDEAYRAGIRPSPEVADSEARKAHLEDMRKIAFDLLGRNAWGLIPKALDD